jgi:large subunit ribosomal protein L10
MAKTKEQKKEMVKNIEEQLGQMKSLVFVDYYGLKVNEIQELRKMLKKESCQYLVTKKTLLNIALKNIGLDKIDLDKIAGGVGLVFSARGGSALGGGSDILPAKMVVSFAKEHGALKIQGGIFERDFIPVEKVEQLAKLPTKPEIIGQLLRGLKGPINNFVYTLKGNLKNLVYVLSAIKDR